MAEMIIMLRRDPNTGKQNIIIKLDSEPDALPHEHEQMHRRLVEKLVGKGIKPEDLGEMIVERETGSPAQPAGHDAERAAETEGRAQGEVTGRRSRECHPEDWIDIRRVQPPKTQRPSTAP